MEACAMRLQACSFRPRTSAPVPDHEHGAVEWHYVLDGRCGFHIGGRELRIGPGDLFAVPPGTPHGVRMPHANDWLLQYIVVAEVDDGGLCEAWRRRAGRRGSVDIGPGRHAFFARLAADAGHADRWRSAGAGHRFAALLCEALAGGGQPAAHPQVERALALMRGHLRDPISMQRIAALVGCDRSHLSRRFARELGLSPMRCYLDLRLELAASMLRLGTRPVAEVAAACGFADPFHFSRCFRRWSGRPPSRWRK